MLSNLRLFLVPRGCETSRLLRKQLIEEQEQALELERMRLADLQLARKSTISQPYFGYIDGLKVSDGVLFFPFVSPPSVLVFDNLFARYSFYNFLP